MLLNSPWFNCQPEDVNFELLHYMCRQGSFNAHANRNFSLFSNENEIDEATTVFERSNAKDY